MTGWVERAESVLPVVAGEVVMASDAAEPEFIVKEFESWDTLPAVALIVFAPARLIDKLVKVATPLDAAMVVVPDKAPVPEVSVMTTFADEVVTRFPFAS